MTSFGMFLWEVWNAPTCMMWIWLVVLWIIIGTILIVRDHRLERERKRRGEE